MHTRFCPWGEIVVVADFPELHGYVEETQPVPPEPVDGVDVLEEEAPGSLLLHGGEGDKDQNLLLFVERLHTCL
jgi:hypothetical protein